MVSIGRFMRYLHTDESFGVKNTKYQSVGAIEYTKILKS